MTSPDHVPSLAKKSRRSSKPPDRPPSATPGPPLVHPLPPTHYEGTTPLAINHRHAPPVAPALPKVPLPPPSLSDPPEVYLPWSQLVRHPGASNLTYRVPSHLLVPAPPPPMLERSSNSRRHQQQAHPPRLPAELDVTSQNFNPSLALSTPTSDLPTGFFQGHTSIPIYDNVAQFTALTWSSGTTAQTPNETTSSTTAPTGGRLALDLSSLTASILASPTPADLYPYWHAWVARLSAVHASFHWDRMHRAIAHTLAHQADAAVMEREARKVRVLKAREAALELRKLLNVWALAEKDDPGVVDHPRHPRWVGVNLRAWEEAGVVMPGGVDVLGRGNAEGEQGSGREGSRGGENRGASGRRSKGSAGSSGLKWSHRKRIRDVRQ